MKKRTGSRNHKKRNEVLRVSAATRAKINRIKDHKPAWSIMAIADEAADALLAKLGISEPTITPRPSAA